MAGEWRESRIAEIAEIDCGGTPSTVDPSNFKADIPWHTPKDLSGPHERYVSRGEANLSRKGLESGSAQLLPVGTVLITSHAPIGHVAGAKNAIFTYQWFRNNGESFEEKVAFLLVQLREQEAEAHRLDKASSANSKELGFGD